MTTKGEEVLYSFLFISSKVAGSRSSSSVRLALCLLPGSSARQASASQIWAWWAWRARSWGDAPAASSSSPWAAESRLTASSGWPPATASSCPRRCWWASAEQSYHACWHSCPGCCHSCVPDHRHCHTLHPSLRCCLPHPQTGESHPAHIGARDSRTGMSGRSPPWWRPEGRHSPHPQHHHHDAPRLPRHVRAYCRKQRPSLSWKVIIIQTTDK